MPTQDLHSQENWNSQVPEESYLKAAYLSFSPKPCIVVLLKAIIDTLLVDEYHRIEKILHVLAASIVEVSGTLYQINGKSVFGRLRWVEKPLTLYRKIFVGSEKNCLYQFAGAGRYVCKNEDDIVLVSQTFHTFSFSSSQISSF